MSHAAEKKHAVDPERREGGARRRELSRPAVDDHQVRPRRFGRLGVGIGSLSFFHPPLEGEGGRAKRVGVG